MKKTLITLGIAMMTISQAQTTLVTNLQGCYQLNCDNAANGVTANNPSLNGTIHSVNCATDRFGTPSSAYEFTNPINSANPNAPGSSYIELPNSTLLRPQALSVSGWYSTYNASNSSYLVWTDNGCTSNFEAYSLYINGSTFYVVQKSCSGAASVNWSGTISSNTWYHVAFTIDNTSIKLYVNGALVSSASSNGSFVYSSGGKVYLGATAGSGVGSTFDSPFSGKMDDIRFYDRVLTASEVSYLYSNNPACDETIPNGNDNGDPDADPDQCCLGNYCGKTVKSLFANRQLDLGQYNFNFTNDLDYKTKVNVGYGCGLLPDGKFNVKANALTASNNVLPFGLPGCIGANALAENNTDWLHVIGTRTEAKTAARNSAPIGLFSTASGPGNAYGVWSQITGTSRVEGEQVAGHFYVYEDDSWRNIGVRGVALGLNSNTSGSNRFNVGVAGYASDVVFPPGPGFGNQGFYPQSNVGVYGGGGNYFNYTTPSNYWAGWFDCDVMVNGTGYNSGFTIFTSDRKFKENIKPVENALSVISKLNPSTYFMKTKNDYGMHFSDKKQFGFISQEVETILPDLVADVHKPAMIDKDGKETAKEVDFKGLNYMAFIAILTKGMQEQQQQIEELKAMVQSLAGKTPVSGNPATSVAVNLSDKNVIVLNQNVPNPFAESTVISYNIPSDFAKAQIIFSTNDGTVIRVIDIKEKGAGSLNVFANDLSHGMYNYILVVDGKTIDTKKMVKE